MRTKRSKAYKRAMALYTNAFKFREPYQVLCDAAFVQSIAKQKVELISRLVDVVGGSVKPMITQCSIAHLYKAGAEGQQAVNFARSLERRKCNHWQTKETDAECIAGVVGTESNRLNYIVATQSTKLRSDMRKVPGVPLLFEKRSIILMEPPSEASMGKRREVEQGKLHAPKSELRPARSKTIVDEDLTGNAEAGPVSGALAASELPAATRSTAASLPATAEQLLARRDRKRKRAHKEPNPLSVKKKKAKRLNTASKSTSSMSSKGRQQVGEGSMTEGAAKVDGADNTESKKENQDPTKGVTRPLGDGSSKKALARKRRKAVKSKDSGSAGSDSD